MASTGSTGNALPHHFILTPHQQSLLFAALHANKQDSTISPDVKSESLQESTYLDNFDDDLGDTSFDFSYVSAGGDQNTMMGGMPSTGNSDCAEGEVHEKRSYPDDDDGETSPGNESKRHESTGKVAKKPGRKPLTSEPTSVSFPALGLQSMVVHFTATVSSLLTQLSRCRNVRRRIGLPNVLLGNAKKST